MKKIILLFVLLIGLFSISKVNVNASTVRRFDNIEINYLDGQSSSVSCDGLITSEGLEIIQEILNWIRIIAPILLIIFVAFDLASAVVSQDNDAIGKATKKIVPRMIGVALLFFVPTIIRAILDMQGIRDSLVIPDDPLCHTMVSKEVDKNYELVI